MLSELNNHVGWTTEIIYVNKAKDMYILLFIQAWVKNITTFVLLNKGVGMIRTEIGLKNR
jgi:hypothetical protein